MRTPRHLYRGLVPLPGAHQRSNLLVALGLLEEARAAGLRFDLRHAVRGIADARWPGRLEWMDGDPPLLLDCAHNPAGARALAAYLEGRGPFVLLFGVMADKDVRGMARPLFPRAAAIVLKEAILALGRIHHDKSEVALVGYLRAFEGMALKPETAAYDSTEVLTLLDRRFTNEPVALVLPRGDEDFRLVVDQKLSQTIRSDSFRGLYARWFGEFDQSTARFFRDTVLPD